MNCITSTPFTLLFQKRRISKAGTLLGADYAQQECTELGDERPCASPRGFKLGLGQVPLRLFKLGPVLAGPLED